MEPKRLYRSTKDRMIGGVCGGIGEYLEVDPTAIRVAYALLTLFTAFCGVILYPILWIIIPEKR
ncbi:MAG: PspC domain-containing protein [Prevotella sp.]|nr:PspC domain-containing protein [Prevotella sp.]MBP3828037.1 PspC domain-containing protein [Prevotella sp.]MBQ3826946.1 PspC domain-containing protein [Prevotella sp.]MBQ7716626.1 PspC domain-containing protein [Prevotella sp.]